MREAESPRQLRLASATRGIVIAVLVGAYAWVFDRPGVSLTASLLIAAALQVAVLVARKFVPPGRMPLALYVFELIADAVTVFLFALGVYGGILKVGMDL